MKRLQVECRHADLRLHLATSAGTYGRIIDETLTRFTYGGKDRTRWTCTY